MFEGGSRVPRPVGQTEPLFSRSGGWEAFVRAASEPSIEGESGESEAEDVPTEPAPLCPTTFPPPPMLPPRSTSGFFSDFVLVARNNDRVRVPHSMIVRDHNTPPIKLQRSICMGCGSHNNCCRGWEIPPANDVVVLSTRDLQGMVHYGWYLRFDIDPHRLVRIPLNIVQGLWALVRKTEGLNTSSLNAEFVDAYMTAEGTDFEAMATLRIGQVGARIKRIRKAEAPAPSRGKKRGLYEDPGPSSKPASPERNDPTQLKGECSVCLEEDYVHKQDCCGSAGAVCTGCRAKMRHLCPVCDRSKVNADYQCASCSMVIPFKEFGFPCSSCNKCTICATCYKHYEECLDCDWMTERR